MSKAAAIESLGKSPMSLKENLIWAGSALAVMIPPPARSAPPLDNASRPVLEASEQREIFGDIEGSFSNIGITARVKNCSSVVRLYRANYSGKNRSYGAVCRIAFPGNSPGGSPWVTVCNTDMIDRFSFSVGKMDPRFVSNFIAFNCPPEG